LEVWATNIGNDYLEGVTKEKNISDLAPNSRKLKSIQWPSTRFFMGYAHLASGGMRDFQTS